MHKRFSSLVVVLISSILLGGCTIRNAWDKKPSGLEINTTPKAKVFLDNEEVGETPYKNENIKSKEYTLRLVPESTSSATIAPWETKIRLHPQTRTIISRSFSSTITDVESSILSLQPESGTTKSFISVISDPDTVNVNLDNKPTGFTPLSKLEVSPGNHTVVISSPGYKPQTLLVNAREGHNLLISVKLASVSYELSPVVTPSSLPALSPSPSPSPSLAPTESATSSAVLAPYVTISDTPDTRSIGGLNIRSEATSTSAAIGIAKVGERLPYHSTSLTGWHEVTFQGKRGWASGKYTTLTK